MKRSRFKPSPAMIVAVMALIVALGGTAVAGGVLNKKKVNTIISNRAPGLSVAKAKNADNATNADNANTLGGLAPTEYKTASNFTSSTTDVPINGTLSTIGSQIQVTTQSSRRLIASAAVHATSAQTNGDYLVCRILIDGTAGVFDTDFAVHTTFSPVDASVSPLASAVVGAGTHTVTLQCDTVGDAPAAMTVGDSALAAWAVAG